MKFDFLLIYNGGDSLLGCGDLFYYDDFKIFYGKILRINI